MRIFRTGLSDWLHRTAHGSNPQSGAELQHRGSFFLRRSIQLAREPSGTTAADRLASMTAPLPPSPAHQKQGPFPLPELPGFIGTVALSDFQAGHHPIDDVEGATFTTPGSPPITQIALPTCRAQYPGGPDRCVSVSSLPVQPSPFNRRVGVHDFTFEACSSFTHVAACLLAAHPRWTSVPRLRPGRLPDRAAR
jgi:hypothetical protein